MNLVEQIFQQAQAGSANGQGFGSSFAEGVQAGQRQQQLDMRKRELAMELAQAPLKQTLLQQDTEMNAAKLQMFLQGRADEAMATQAFAGLAGQVSPLLAEGKIDEAQNALLDAGVNNAFLLNDPRFKSLYDYTTKAQDAKLELVRARAANQSFIPEEILVPSSVPGQPPLRVLRKGPNTSEVVNTEEDALRKRALELQAQRLEKQLPDEAKAELKSLYKEIDRKKEQLDQLPLKSGMVWNRVDNPKRAALQADINKLREKAAQLSKGASPAPSTPPPAAGAFEVGKTYIDANGNRAIYRGDGNWTPLP